jgi:hypothetical protein
MSQIYNIYCDESCHLEHDRQKSMVIGGIWCPKEKVKEINKRIFDIKNKHEIKKDREIKWTKISPAKINFYIDLVDYFFDNQDLHFRCVAIPDKSVLDYKKYKHSHDDFYYKIYFDMLKVILSPEDTYNIFLDIKDTKGAIKVEKLQEVLCNNMLDFNKQIVKRIQLVRSDEIGIIQLVDLLVGAMAYFHRGEMSGAKKMMIDKIKERSGYELTKNTLYREEKFNILIWNPLN